ncbi:hypothetical protein AcV7_004486 [Taiwanofungus camphoratus]|nr:hypothetical protein AcV7_004486 [Antrodia cinnamomea]
MKHTFSLCAGEYLLHLVCEVDPGARAIDEPEMSISGWHAIGCRPGKASSPFGGQLCVYGYVCGVVVGDEVLLLVGVVGGVVVAGKGTGAAEARGACAGVSVGDEEEGA